MSALLRHFSIFVLRFQIFFITKNHSNQPGREQHMTLLTSVVQKTDTSILPFHRPRSKIKRMYLHELSRVLLPCVSFCLFRACRDKLARERRLGKGTQLQTGGVSYIGDSNKAKHPP